MPSSRRQVQCRLFLHTRTTSLSIHCKSTGNRKRRGKQKKIKIAPTSSHFIERLQVAPTLEDTSTRSPKRPTMQLLRSLTGSEAATLPSFTHESLHATMPLLHGPKSA